MFEFLLKKSPVVFSSGTFAFKFWPSLIGVVFLLGVFFAVLWLVYRKTTITISNVLKGTLIAVKFVAIAVLIFILLEPVISVSKVTPRKSSLLLLVDDSKSMSIKDVQNQTRRTSVAQLLGDAQNPGVMAQLSENFKLQLYKFSSDVSPIADSEQLQADGDVTDLSASLSRAAEIAELGAVSGVVLLSDGVDTGEDDPLQTAGILKSQELPVFTVGVGSDNAKDVELSKVTANHSVIENSVVELSALIKKRNYPKREVELELREQGSIIKKQTLKLDGAATRTNLTFSPQKKGFVTYSLSIVPLDDEAVYENNSQTFLIDNRSKRARVLYIEGYPRAEFKYLRRAVDADVSIELVSLLRTGPEKFYRQGIKSQKELQSGYPKTKRELFKYDAIVFGSIEADFFTDAELQNTVDFVSQRGGGFMMLGGGNSFAQGGYADTPIAKMLPVELSLPQRSEQVFPSTFRDKFKAVLTPQGLRNPMLQLAPDSEDNRSFWESLPELEGYNPLGKPKPGATVLLVHPLSEPRNPKPILAQQRFGRGRTTVWASASSWLWQMGMPHEDMSHERFWRQLFRWLTLDSPRPIETHLDKDIYVPHEQVSLTVDVRDSAYVPIEDAEIKARVIKPSGEVVEVPFHWSSNGKVAYVAAFHPDEEGLYHVEVSAYTAGDRFLGESRSAFFVEPSKREFANAQLQAPLLKRIAEISGGKYYDLDEANRLPDEISVRQSTYSKLVEYDLWDMPLLFLLLVLILSAEWYVRRSRGLS